nr:group II intron maturase-specific domain-containing protein [Staphylococcus pseudintermedius]
MITEISQVTRGWINYFGICFIRVFLATKQPWSNSRLQQYILKRCARVVIKSKMYSQ